MADSEIKFGIQECSKCKYKLRCEECFYNEKDISKLIKFEKANARKETAREILKDFDNHGVYSKDYTDFMRKQFGVDIKE